MPRKTCYICDVRKDVTEFKPDKRNLDGYENRCRQCTNTSARAKIECPKCKKSYTKATLVNHMKTTKCIQGEAKWKHPMPQNKRFKSNGQKIVKCPCKHKSCAREIKERTAYKHMKYGIGYRFPSQNKPPRVLKRKERRPTPIIELSDSERDL